MKRPKEMAIHEEFEAKKRSRGTVEVQTAKVDGSASSSNQAAPHSQVSSIANLQSSDDSSAGSATHSVTNPTPQPKITLRFPPTFPLEMRTFLLEVLGGTPGEGDEFTVERLRGGEVNIDEMMRGFLGDNDLDDDNVHAGASMQEINELPVSQIQAASNPGEACACCLEIPSTGDHIRHLPCLHKFHRNCIDRWLRQRPSCPLCKFPIRG